MEFDVGRARAPAVSRVGKMILSHNYIIMSFIGKALTVTNGAITCFHGLKFINFSSIFLCIFLFLFC